MSPVCGLSKTPGREIGSAAQGGDGTIAGPPVAIATTCAFLGGTSVAHPSQVLHDRYNLPDTTYAWSHAAKTSEEPEKRIRIYKLLSFDVYGTLMDTPPVSAKAFGRILADTGASNVDPATFGSFWEQRNIAHYYEPYRSYKEIGRLSLDEAFRHFGIAGGNPDSIRHYFDAFTELRPYPDTLPTLEKLSVGHRIALVSNIDDDLLAATPIPKADLICTAERARGYKPDGTLFRYLIAHAGVGVREILHSGQSQHTDMVGGKPLGLTVAWINRRHLDLHPSVPKPDHVFPDLRPLVSLTGC